MSSKYKKLSIGIVGCGAIGSQFALSLKENPQIPCSLSGIFDIDEDKMSLLAKKISKRNIRKESLDGIIERCDLVVEAVTAPNACDVIKKSLKVKKNVLAMSVSQLFLNQDLFKLAKKNKCSLIPSGAIAGLDAIKAASSVPFQRIVLTTRKPPSALENSLYLAKKKIDISCIKKETVLYDGDVEKAVKYFPKNINVAATLALACGQSKKIKVRIITSPKFRNNSHSIEMIGASGKISTCTINNACPDNPKTSYLAALSGFQMLKQFCLGINIGT